MSEQDDQAKPVTDAEANEVEEKATENEMAVDGSKAAKEAAQQAAAQAKETASEALKVFKGFDLYGKAYVIALLVMLLFILLFSIVSFEVRSSGPVSETMAKDQTEFERRLNADTYSAARVLFWGQILFISGAAGIGIFVRCALTKQTAAWVPLAATGCAALCTLILMLLFFLGSPSRDFFSILPDYLEPDIDLTIFGYWIPLLCSFVATAVSVKRILDA